MDTREFDFDLPEELIAQTPLSDRTASRLLVLHARTGRIQHESFSDLTTHFKKGDCIVLNDTRVIPARLFGFKEDTGAKIEILLLHEQEHNCWEALVKPAKKVNIGTVLTFGEGKLKATCIALKEHGGRVFELAYDGILYEVLDQLGDMPLPPYIKTALSDKERYQTVYAKNKGSAAAPTAGLHFTKETMKELSDMGVTITYVTLHVGLGTFRPVSAKSINEHDMHSEYYHMSEETAQTLTNIKSKGGRIFAVGTTSTRVLETIVRDHHGIFTAASGWTDIFIYPPYQFSAIDGLLTNFHLPQSTLMMLVSAFASKDHILDAYEEAIKNNYRFFSFGDAMLLLS